MNPGAANSQDHPSRRHAIAKLRLEWELLKFSLKGRKAGFDPNQPRDELGRWTDGGGASEGVEATDGRMPVVLAASRGGGISGKLLQLTVREFISRMCKGGINRELPTQFENVTIADLLEIARGGDRAARKCYKLLNERRFRK